MAEAVMGFTISRAYLCNSFQTTKLLDTNPSARTLRQCSTFKPFNGWQQVEGNKNKRFASLSKVNAFPDLPLMAVLVEHIEGQRDLITIKSVWHLSDRAIKDVYVFYMMFTCWGCMVFSAMKDPYYDSEAYRKDGGDGTGHWMYEKQEDIEEAARAELWREELIEEIEQKVGAVRELEEVGTKQ